MNSSCTYNILQRCVLVIAMMGGIVCGWAQGTGTTPGGDVHVAKIGETPYATLAAAIEAVEAESTITLLDNITVGEEDYTDGVAYTINKQVIIDLNGHTITANPTETKEKLFEIKSEGILSIIGTGGIEADDNVNYMFYNQGKLTISNGTFSSDNAVVFNTGGSANCTVTNGSFTATGNALVVENSATLNIDGGSFTANDAIVVKNGAKLNVTGGTIIGVNNAIISDNIGGGGPTITISGGVVKCEDGVAICHKGGSLTIEGVVIPQISGITALDVQGGSVSVTNGTFTGTVQSIEGIKHFITGGTFSEQPNADLCVNGLAFEGTSDNRFGLVINITDQTDLSNSSSLDNKKYKSTYTRNTGMVGAGSDPGTGTKYGTICLPFSINGPVTGVKLYKATSVDASTLTIEEVIPASGSPILGGTPLIFELSTAAETMTVTSTNATVKTSDPASYSAADNRLVGTYSEKNITTELENIYYLNGDKFYKAHVSLKVPPYRAYLKVASTTVGSRPSVMSIVQGSGNVTGIVETDAFEAVSDVYDISGNKRTGLQQGVNIMHRADGTSFRVIVK